jgi:hypothetical protein
MIFFGGKILPLGDKTKPSNFVVVWHFFFTKIHCHHIAKIQKDL